MWAHVGLMGGFCLLLVAVIVCAYQWGKKKAKTQALEQTAKRRARASKILDRAHRMDESTVRRRLRSLSDK